MGIRSFIAKPAAKYIYKKTMKWAMKPMEVQMNTLLQLVNSAKNTKFGIDHAFDKIKSYNDFKNSVPVGDYEQLKPYIEKIKAGEKDILWPGLPLYFAKTSGTTSGVKYIPLTKDSVYSHFNSARDALLHYVHDTGKASWMDKNYIFLSGSPKMKKENGIFIGRLSGISNHQVPTYLRTNQLPSYKTNCIEDWETKLDHIIQETLGKPMSLISGIPPWVQMYFDKIVAKTGKQIKEVFPDFSVFVYGGVNFKPYRKKLFDTIGKQIDSVETYPASEGFLAYQDKQADEGMLLLLNNGIFFEFIPTATYFDENPVRLTVDQVEIGVNYAVIINSNAGLWGYSIGDTVTFTSKEPHRVLVTGRIKHFISAFGEHVIGQEVEKAMNQTLKDYPEVSIIEYTVAPNVTPKQGLPHHEWLVAFDNPPNDLQAFQKSLNLYLQKLNTYYDDLIVGNILSNLIVSALEKDAFIKYMKTEGKLGGQNKVPRLSNDRKIAEQLSKFKI